MNALLKASCGLQPTKKTIKNQKLPIMGKTFPGHTLKSVT
jgi:hypothetical protein